MRSCEIAGSPSGRDFCLAIGTASKNRHGSQRILRYSHPMQRWRRGNLSRKLVHIRVSNPQGDSAVVEGPELPRNVEISPPGLSPEVGNNILPAGPLSSRDSIEVSELPLCPSVNPWRRRWAMLGTILMFAGPALSIPLGDPLMSLVDTVCIGQFASTLELAALGPNTLIFQFATYVFGALATACTCLMSEFLDLKKRVEAASVLSTSLMLAFGIGAAQLLVLTIWGPQMIAMTGCPVELIAPAWTYLRIRALAAPSVLLLMVAQSGLLAQKDSWTPCLGVLVQLVLNCACDVLLIGYFKGGLAGAAWATVFAQWAGTLVTLWSLPRGGRIKPSLRIKKDDISRLSETFGPATLILLCKNIVYVAVTGTASSLPRLQAAAHQPLYGVWNLGGFAHVPLEQAALAFIPAAASRKQGRETVGLLLGLAVAVGLVTSSLTAGIPTLLPQLFTSDATLFPVIRSVAPQALLSIFLCALDVCSGGILVASKDMGFLVRVMGVALPMVLGGLTLVRRNAYGLTGIWWTLVLFFAFRAANSCGRIFYLSRQPGSFLHKDSQAGEDQTPTPPAVAAA